MKAFHFFGFVVLPLVSGTLSAQVHVQEQSWFSVNATVKLSNRWGFMADAHQRRTNFLANSSFHLLRAGGIYWIKPNLSIAAGYASLWLAPVTPGWKTYSQENRIYQQAQMPFRWRKVQLVQRLRTEQRWTQRLVQDSRAGTRRFTGRYRYLLSATIPIFSNARYPKLVLADELLLRSGREAVGVFDQNRWFVGLRQAINNHWSFDLGYMQVYQQRLSGGQYDRNHTLRWFWYYSFAAQPHARQHHQHHHAVDQGE